MITALAIAVGVYALAVALLALAGRRTDARALAGFVPDCLVLMRRLLAEGRHRVLLAAALAYLASPVDLVPDFLPVVGQLDDLLVVALVLRRVLRTDPDRLAALWPGPERSLRVIERAVGA